LENVMLENQYSPEQPKEHRKAPEARYAYYRRCQVFRRGEQCKAPAEMGSHICYAHAGQLAMAQRRERERQAVLAEAVAQMRQRGNPDCEMADLFMDLKGINMTLAVMAKALIAGRIDCKTAGRLLVQLQTVSKILRTLHRKGHEDRKESQILPQICADERRLENQKPTAEVQRRGEEPKNLPLISADNTDLREAKANLTAEARSRGEGPKSPEICGAERGLGKNWAANEREETRIALLAEVAIASRRGWAPAPPELLGAA
jgi:hypothetical protein